MLRTFPGVSCHSQNKIKTVYHGLQGLAWSNSACSSEFSPRSVLSSFTTLQPHRFPWIQAFNTQRSCCLECFPPRCLQSLLPLFLQVSVQISPVSREMGVHVPPAQLLWEGKLWRDLREEQNQATQVIVQLVSSIREIRVLTRNWKVRKNYKFSFMLVVLF